MHLRQRNVLNASPLFRISAFSTTSSMSKCEDKDQESKLQMEIMRKLEVEIVTTLRSKIVSKIEDELHKVSDECRRTLHEGLDMEKHRQAGISSEVVDRVIRGIKSEKKYEAVTKAANPNVRNGDVVCEPVKLDAGVL
jgi:hypothetical protein